MLEVLPAGVTYTWVVPSEIFGRVQDADNAAAVDDDARELREALGLVLSGSGWREVPRGLGEFEATVFVQRRLRTRPTARGAGERAPDVALGSVCDPLVRDPRLAPCPNSSVNTALRAREQYVDRIAVLGIRRTDGAGLYHMVPVTTFQRTSDSLANIVIRKLIAGQP
ncbi:MAG: hypothetical protein IT357_10515 [Gemmatimonadaceae bacterium]|nr:hypothetical protein [Gemmatimonadaceae bacterium]